MLKMSYLDIVVSTNVCQLKFRAPVWFLAISCWL